MNNLDREIAEQLFDHDPNLPGTLAMLAEPIHPYSNDISKAWLVVEEMERRHQLDFSLDKAFNTGWFATFTNEPTSAKLRMHGDGRADTAAEAVCRAALEALKDD